MFLLDDGKQVEGVAREAIDPRDGTVARPSWCDRPPDTAGSDAKPSGDFSLVGDGALIKPNAAGTARWRALAPKYMRIDS